MLQSPRPPRRSTDQATVLAPASQTTDNGVSTEPLEKLVRAELDRLEVLDANDLRIRYRQLTRKTAPSHLPRWLLLRIVAYRIQARAFGDLDADALKFLAGVAKALELERKNQTAANTEDGDRRRPIIPRVPPVAPRTRFRPGTLLMREHAGELHRVMVVEQGYQWNGCTYGSLSEVARAITGTIWNGPYFFGLRNKTGRADANQEKGPTGAEHEAC